MTLAIKKPCFNKEKSVDVTTLIILQYNADVRSDSVRWPLYIHLKKYNNQQCKIWEFMTPLGCKKSQTTHLKLDVLRLKLGILRVKLGISETQNRV